MWVIAHRQIYIHTCRSTCSRLIPPTHTTHNPPHMPNVRLAHLICVDTLYSTVYISEYGLGFVIKCFYKHNASIKPLEVNDTLHRIAACNPITFGSILDGPQPTTTAIINLKSAKRTSHTCVRDHDIRKFFLFAIKADRIDVKRHTECFVYRIEDFYTVLVALFSNPLHISGRETVRCTIMCSGIIKFFAPRLNTKVGQVMCVR